MIDSWIICEKSGRWAAALRTAMMRLSTGRVGASIPLRVREVRNLEEFQSALCESHAQLGLVEVRRENLTAILELLSSPSHTHTPIVALLDESLRGDSHFDCQPASAYQLSTDVLGEAGALAIIDSPRRVSELLALAEVLAASSHFAAAAGEPRSFTDWAWAALPWQDE